MTTSDALARALRAFCDRPVADALPRHKAVVFHATDLGRAGDPTLAQSAVDKLQDGEEPTPEELTALDACIRLVRPVLFVQDRRIVPPAGRADVPGLSADRRPAVESCLESVASVGPKNNPTGIGTAFLVGERVLLTALHVAEDLRFGNPVAWFAAEYERQPLPAPVPIRRTVARHPLYDVAVLELAADPPAAARPLPLARAPVLTAGRAVLTVGHPQKDPHHSVLGGVLFDGVFGYKRASPGEILGADRCGLLLHDCTTLRGSSGSPILDPESARVIGVHTFGFFGRRNGGVHAAAIAADPAVARFVADWR
ncbi:MAG TPA: serine protease [Urbifossiella sp.]|nr:serine protease [Urbifossiella sp.]